MRKRSKTLGIIMLSLVIVALAAFGFMGQMSRNQENIPTYDKEKETLGLCPDKPNCISSFEKESDSHFFAPLKTSLNFLNKADEYFKKNCQIQEKSEFYRYYTCRTAIFGFVDDIEILFKTETNHLYFRSASRIGYSDRGLNTKRIEGLILFLDK